MYEIMSMGQEEDNVTQAIKGNRKFFKFADMQ